ncbi:MAG: SDR family NAD(P)-dependent oxidoreductase [Candidatus Dormibacteraeota bacterium]|nr:SDR family NAD(P)-dependent oxidoreductase [Candidatus Dormibacteraeota bacterium]
MASGASPSFDSRRGIAVVTGASSGIGKEVARQLVRLGAEVVAGVRDLDRGEAAKAEIAGGAEGRVHVLQVDVATPASVHAFVQSIQERFGSVQVLVNNAGAWFTDRRLNPDKVELTFATNVLGPHLLTGLLADPLRAEGGGRVVNVVSAIATKPDLTDLQFERRPYDGYQAYAQSKGALRMITWGSANRFQGTGVTVNAAAPGFVRTGFNRNARGLRTAFINLSARLFAVSPERGADTPLWVATAQHLEQATGRYFSGRREREGGLRDPDAVAELERRCRELEESLPI